MTSPNLIALAAGGTGGHLFPAQALSEELLRRGRAIAFFTDRRTSAMDQALGSVPIYKVGAATFSGRGMFGKCLASLHILRGVATSLGHLMAARPRALVAFGGYPCLPPALAARLSGVPVILHEQNAVMGRANRALAPLARVIAGSVASPRGLSAKAQAKVVVTGNPVRKIVLAAAQQAYTAPTSEGQIKLLVFGGSQGARVFSDVMPLAAALLPQSLKSRLKITQQCRPEDIERVSAAYNKAGLDTEIASFFTDLPARIADAHLVVARSGASTVSELAVIGRPAVLFPLPNAIDQDQAANAAIAEKAGGAIVVNERTLTPQHFADQLTGLLGDSEKLRAMSIAMRKIGRADAVERLADVVEACADAHGVRHAHGRGGR